MSTSSKKVKISNIKLSSHLVQEINVHFYKKFVMPRQNKRASVGSTASCLSHFIHPSTKIRGKYPNTHRKERLTNLFITVRKVRSICRGSKATEAYLFCNNDFENVDFYAASRNVTITAEGPSERLFEPLFRGNNDNHAPALLQHCCHCFLE